MRYPYTRLKFVGVIDCHKCEGLGKMKGKKCLKCEGIGWLYITTQSELKELIL